jgi:hypothetical protein
MALLYVAAFLCVGLPMLYLVLRVFVVGGELGRGKRRVKAVAEVAFRADGTLCWLEEIIDDLRRHRTSPEIAEEPLRAGWMQLRALAEEARRVDGVGQGCLAEELARADRALELVEHGRMMLLDGASDQGDTSIKRGYLSLLHARESVRARPKSAANSLGGR